MKNKPGIISQSGTAIVVALFVTALVAAAATAMIEHLSIDTRRTELILNNNQANLYAQGSVAWAMDQLINDLNQKQSSRVVDRTPIISPNNTINNATISSVIEDAQGRLNLNNLTDAQYQTVLTRLITLVAPQINQTAAHNITLAVVDWITQGLHDTSFDQAYKKMNPPYLSPHRVMSSISELRLVKGMTPALYTLLEPNVIVLPDRTKININSAPIPVIMSFSPNITLETAKALDQLRRQSPLITLDMLGNFPDIKNNSFAQGNLTVTSDFFLLKTHVTIGDQDSTLTTLLMRLLKNSQPAVNIMWQSKGTL